MNVFIRNHLPSLHTRKVKKITIYDKYFINFKSLFLLMYPADVYYVHVIEIIQHSFTNRLTKYVVS
jgi:hypothetical protein